MPFSCSPFYEPIAELDEILAEAISKDFYESFVNWKRDTYPPPSATQKVPFQRWNPFCYSIMSKGRHWVEMWQSHLGNEATPKALVEKINKKNVVEAKNLKDIIKEEFGF